MSIAIDTFIAFLGITWSLTCGIGLCMHMLCFRFYCVYFLLLISLVIFDAWIILKLFLESTFNFLMVSLVQSPLRINEMELGSMFFYLCSLCVFFSFLPIVRFLVNFEGDDEVFKKNERHNTHPSTWEWYGRSFGTQLHPSKIVSTHT